MITITNNITESAANTYIASGSRESVRAVAGVAVLRIAARGVIQARVGVARVQAVLAVLTREPGPALARVRVHTVNALTATKTRTAEDKHDK